MLFLAQTKMQIIILLTNQMHLLLQITRYLVQR